MRLLIWVMILLLAGATYEYASNIEPQQGTVIKKEPLTLTIDMEKYNAIDYLNELREAVGLVEFMNSDILEKSADNHANYLLENSVVSHNESRNKKGYTGETIAQRVKAVGYKASYVSENLSAGSRNYKESIDGLFSAIYHRFGFLDFKVDEIGIGVVQNQKEKEKTSYVYNMGIRGLQNLCKQKSFSGYGQYIQGACFDKDFKIEEKRYKQAFSLKTYRNPKVIVYPYENQHDVPPAFFEETPDPLPSYAVSGFPISISFDEERVKKLKFKSFRLFDSEHQEITDTLFYDHERDINHMFKKYEFALFPLKRLEWGSQYFVEVRYKENGEEKKRAWSFWTREFSEKLYRVVEKSYHAKIKKEVPVIFYFPPNSANDIIENITFPTYVDVGLIDNNTIRVMVFDDAPDEFKLNIGEHELLLEIR